MATFTGENGAVYVGGSSGGEAAVAEVRSWTVEHSKDVIEDTVMGDEARTYKAGLHQFTGSMEVVYDSTHSSNATNGDVFRPDMDDPLYVEFYPDTTTGEKYTGQILVTSVSRSASYDDLVTATVNFQGTGVLDIQTV